MLHLIAVGYSNGESNDQAHSIVSHVTLLFISHVHAHRRAGARSHLAAWRDRETALIHHHSYHALRHYNIVCIYDLC